VDARDKPGHDELRLPSGAADLVFVALSHRNFRETIVRQGSWISCV
jgi:hypothetical protein